MQMRRSTWSVLALGTLFCGLTLGTAPAHATIADIVPGPANPHFFFLPPIAPVPASLGVFDDSLLPYLAVEVCELSGPYCVKTTPLARFTSGSGPGSDRLRVAPRDGHYLVDWHTRGSRVIAGQRYRIRVLAAHTELGQVDLDIVKGARSGPSVGVNQSLVIVEGQTLPIKFRIERGAISVVGPDGGQGKVDTTGGTITTADGSVTLMFRPETVSGETDITIQRRTTFPAGPGFVLPRTVFEFGPTGTIFNRAVQLAIVYDPADIPANVAEGTLRLHKVIDGVWREVPGSFVDPETNTVTGSIDSFSVYGVVARVGTGPGPTISGFGTATVDGTMSAGEWDFAGHTVFLASLPGGTTAFATFYVMNDATNLYLAVRFDRNVQDPENSLEITFDGNHDGITVPGDDNLRFVVGANPEFQDEHWTTTCGLLTSFCTYPDAAWGGTSDGQGAFTHSGMSSVYEIAHPLKSADSTHDISTGPGKTIGFRLALRMKDTNGNLAETFFPGQNTYGHILIQPAPVPLLGGVGTATLDGTMSGEWADASCIFAPITVPGGATTPGEFCVMNDQSNLYVGLRFKRASGDSGNSLAVEFDNNNDGVAQNGDDVIVYNPDVGFADAFRTNVSPCSSNTPAACAIRDTDHGGSNNGAGAFTNDGTYSTYEMSHPLNSGDTGHDFALAAGDRVGFFFSARIIQPPSNFPADFGDTNFPGFRNYAQICIRAPSGDGSECAFASKFFRDDACAKAVLQGTPYDMNDPNWLVNGKQNRNVCAYKFFSAFHMLGYNTKMGSTLGAKDPQLRVLHAFQTQHGLPVGDFMTLDVLFQLDALLALREAKIAAIANAFPLYDHMQPLLANQVSQDWLAYIYHLPMTVLPPTLQMAAYETAQCIWGQCLGFLQDPNGTNLPCQQAGCYTTDLTSVDYRFAGAYFDPKVSTPWLPSAAVDVGTVLHEYAHYLDGTLSRFPFAGLPHLGTINTLSFYNISYDMSQYQVPCAPPRSTNPRDWITLYAFVGTATCPVGQSDFIEEFPESFWMYVAAGKHFRAAAQQNATIAQKYNWLKTNVFQGIEYDTDLQGEVHSGCNDVPGYQQAQPGYASCSESYIWDGELRRK